MALSNDDGVVLSAHTASSSYELHYSTVIFKIDKEGNEEWGKILT